MLKLWLIAVLLAWAALANAQTVAPAPALAVVAAGTTQATATQLYTLYTQVSTVASGAGVVLPTFGVAGVSPITIVNQGANPLIVYPPLGAAFIGGSANDPTTLAVGTTAEFAYTSATSIGATPSAAGLAMPYGPTDAASKSYVDSLPFPPSQLGVYNDYVSTTVLGGFESPAEVFEQWLGRPLGSLYTIAYTVGAFDCVGGGTACMTSTGNIYAGGNYWVPASRPNIVWTVSLTACDHAVNIVSGNTSCTAAHTIPLSGANSVASGFEDSVFNTVFSTIKSGWPNALVSLGNEMNEANFLWAVGASGGSTIAGCSTGMVGCAAQYVAAFRHVAAIAHSYGLRVVWCPGLGAYSGEAQYFYPGDAYVDVIAEDFYEYQSQNFSYYVSLAGNGTSLNWFSSFAAAHNKPMAFDEWGCGGTLSTDAHCVNMIQNMISWLAQHKVLYANFWNSNSVPTISKQVCGSGISGICGPPYQNPLSAAAFLTAFAANNVVTTGASGLTTIPAAPPFAPAPLPLAAVYQVASTTGSGTACTVAAPCTITQAQTNARAQSAGSRTIYLRSGTYVLPQLSAVACGFSFNGAAGINVTSGSDATEVWATYPGDATAILDGSATSAAPVVGYSSSAAIAGTALTLGGTVQGTWQVGQTVSGTGVTFGTTISSGSGNNWVVNNSQTVGARALSGATTTQVGIAVQNTTTAPKFYNLHLRDFAFAAIYTCGNPVVIENNEVDHSGNIAVYNNDSGAIYLSDPRSSVVSNNYVHDNQDVGIVIQQNTNSVNFGTVISNNAIINNCITANNGGTFGDCGAIQVEGGGGGVQGNGTLLITNNYIRDVFSAGGGNNVNGGYGIYSDSGDDLLESGNVITGLKGFCFFIKGADINITGNICDLFGAGAAATAIARVQTPATVGNVFQNNIIVGNASGAAGLGWNTDAGGITFPTVQNNLYYNYTAGGTVANTCTNTCGVGGIADQYLVPGNPLLHCYGAILSPSSPAMMLSRVQYPRQPVLWDQPGFWGPIGFTIPQTGTAPIWPVTSGDGVACTATN